MEEQANHDGQCSPVNDMPLRVTRLNESKDFHHKCHGVARIEKSKDGMGKRSHRVRNCPQIKPTFVETQSTRVSTFPCMAMASGKNDDIIFGLFLN